MKSVLNQTYTSCFVVFADVYVQKKQAKIKMKYDCMGK